MSRRLPPLNPLRAFEATARHLSFSRAARELHVTQPAISHQVRALEQHLGERLFVRRGRALSLTPTGTGLLPATTEALDAIAEAWNRVRAAPGRAHLSVRLPPHFSARWLMPRLGSFFRRHAWVDLDLHHAVDPITDLDRAGVDLAVTWDDRTEPGTRARPLLELERVPACSPRLLGGRLLRGPADLEGFTLLHEFDHEDWRRWLSRMASAHAGPAQGPTGGLPGHGIVVDNYEVLFEAALDGQGIGLLLYPMFADHLRNGELVMPFGDRVGIEFTYFLKTSRRAALRPEVRAFQDWILEEAHGFRRTVPVLKYEQTS